MAKIRKKYFKDSGVLIVKSIKMPSEWNDKLKKMAKEQSLMAANEVSVSDLIRTAIYNCHIKGNTAIAE